MLYDIFLQNYTFPLYLKKNDTTFSLFLGKRKLFSFQLLGNY